MSVAQNVSARVAIKRYASGVMTANALAVSASDLGASGGQILRRVTSTINLGKDTYTSAEINSHRQIQDYRHGVRRVTGGIVSGEFSPGTYFGLFEDVLRTTAVAAVSVDESDMTSVAADSGTGKFTFAGGNPVTEGFRVGSIVRPANLSAAANNGKNFLILAFGGTSNREVTVFPPPTTMSADTAFTFAEVGKSAIMPASGFVDYKSAIEHYFSDSDFARLFTEVRTDGFNLQLPATGLSTIDFTGMGRSMEVYSGGAAPFLTSPTAETGTGLLAAVNGALYIQGTRIGVLTGLSLQAQLNASGDPVVGQNFVPEVYRSRLNLTGQATIMLEDATFINYFNDETPVTLLAFLTADNTDAADAVSIFLPRIKLGDAATPLQGDAGIVQTCPFQALKGLGVTAGHDATTIRIHDTAAV